MENMNKIETYRKMRSDFYKKFKNNCAPVLQNFESERIRLKNIVTAIGIISVIAITASIGYFILFAGIIDDVIITPIVIISGLIAAGINHFCKTFERKIKKRIMPVVCECFENLKWVENPYVDHTLHEKSGLISEYYNKIAVDDVFEGTFREVPMNIEEVEYTRVESRTSARSGYREEKTTVFKGIFVTLQMNKNFNSHTLVKQNAILKNVNISGLRHTTLEDVQFEKQFDVFTNDEVEARYLLTPSFMERLSDMRRTFSTSRISCAFFQNRFIIALDTRRDMFKLGSLFKKADDTKQFFQLYEEIEAVVKLIDHFKLDQKIGL